MILPDDNEFSYLLGTGNTRSTTAKALCDDTIQGEGALEEAWGFLAMISGDEGFDNEFGLEWSYRYTLTQ